MLHALSGGRTGQDFVPDRFRAQVAHEVRMPSARPVVSLRGPSVRHCLTVGDQERHEVEVRYGRALRTRRVAIDGRTVYRHWSLLPWAERRARDFKTPGREAHTFIVEPPGAPMNPATIPGCYLIWLDGKLLLRVER